VGGIISRAQLVWNFRETLRQWLLCHPSFIPWPFFFFLSVTSGMRGRARAASGGFRRIDRKAEPTLGHA